MNTLCCDGGKQMNLATPKQTAIPLGPPRQSKTQCSIPTSSVGNIFKSVGCQAPSNTTTPEKVAEEVSRKKPHISTSSIKVHNILHDKFVYW